ncbi:MAG: dihydrodipicolinate synthase family protein [Phycisphaerales bacterium]
MKPFDWRGVFPAITTPFTPDGDVDLEFMGEHARWMIDRGCSGIIALGSLGEGGTLDPAERRRVLETLVAAAGSRAPVVASVAAMSQREALRQASEAEAVGCQALMVLPPYVYPADSRELPAYFEAVMAGEAGVTGGLPCMLYNNPVAYGLDMQPDEIADLAAKCPRLQAVKESSGDVRRVTALSAALRKEVPILVGVDDLLVEGVCAGATGWVAGLANAFPEESVRLLTLSRAASTGDERAARDMKALYAWFLPLLRFDTGAKFVHLIKLVQERVGRGSSRVRAPRLALSASERANAEAVISRALESIPPEIA